MDQLSPNALHQVEALGSHNTTVSGIRDPKDIAVYDAIQEGIKRANLHATSNAQRVSPLACNVGQFMEHGLFVFILYVRRFKNSPFFPKTFQFLEVNWVSGMEYTSAC